MENPHVEGLAKQEFSVGERVTVNFGTCNVRGERTEPFLATVGEFMTNGFYKVRRCSIPRRASTVEAAHIHKLCQYMPTTAI